MRLFGFTLLRNGVKYDYSFEESLRSLAGVVEEIYIAVGESDDGTVDRVSKLPKVKIIPTVWDENLREGGLILSQQTNMALNRLREESVHYEDAWGFYLQADEVLHEEDSERILRDIEIADRSGHDVCRFRYLHFWQDHESIAINKKWYPQEIRAIRLDSEIESWGDAQSFRNFSRAYESDAHIFHYGHVRQEESYKLKKTDMLKLYHWEDKLPKYRRREKRFDDQTEVLPFFGSHPAVMKERILRLGGVWRLPERDEIFIVGKAENYSTNFIEKINAKKTHWMEHPAQIKGIPKHKIVWAEPSWLQRWLYSIHSPQKMRSKLARPWTKEFQLQIKLFERGVGLR